MYQALELTAPLLCLFNYQLLQVLQATTLPVPSYTILKHNSSTSSRNGSPWTLPAKGHIYCTRVCPVSWTAPCLPHCYSWNVELS